MRKRPSEKEETTPEIVKIDAAFEEKNLKPWSQL
jgi:hypothetical protein